MKALTLNELIVRLQDNLEMFPELGEYKVRYRDWNEMSWEVEEGILDVCERDKVVELG